MDYFLQQSLNGLNLGCMYAFLALGYTMVYGVLRLVNFAHSEFFMAGGMAGYFCLGLPLSDLQLPAPLSLLVGILAPILVGGLAGGVVAVICEGLVYRPLRGEGRRAASVAAVFGVLYGVFLWGPLAQVVSAWGAALGLAGGMLILLGPVAPRLDPPGTPRPPGSRLTGLLAALGLSLALQQGVAWAFSADPRAWPEPRRLLRWDDLEALGTGTDDLYYLDGSARRYPFPAGEPINPQFVTRLRDKFPGLYQDIVVSSAAKQGLVIAALLVAILGLYFLIERTMVGKAIRALSWNPEAARLMGINPNRIVALTFLVGGGLGGVGGALWGMSYGKVDPFMGFLPGLKAFVAAVVGGIGSIPGAILGGLSLGYLETLLAGYGFGAYRDALAFLALLVVLLIRPAGLLGKTEGEKI